MLSAGSIKRLIQPLNCASAEAESDFVKYACEVLKKNYASEEAVFENGMSISDIMDAHTKRFSYSEIDQWTNRRGNYCMLGDW